MDSSTSNTYGFPAGTQIPSFANFGVSRLDVLNNELSSGYYSNSGDIAALTREIGRVTSGQTGDMMAAQVASTGDMSWFHKFMEGLKAVSGAPANYIGDAIKSTATDTVKSTSNGIVDSIKQYFKDSGVTMAAVVVGIVLLVGAFFIYRR